MNSPNKPCNAIDTSPVFLCDIDGRILIANKHAEESALVSLLNTNISKYLSSADSLRFDITMKSKKPRPFTAAAKLVCGKRFLAVIPNPLSYYRVAIVAIEKSASRARELMNSDFFSLNNVRYLCERLEGVDILPSGGYNNQLFDARKALEYVISEITAENHTDLSFNIDKTSNADSFMCSSGLESFVAIIVAIVFAMNNISASSIVDIFISASDEICSISFETEFDEGFPSRKDAEGNSMIDFSDLRPDFLRFAAECSDCALDISINGSRLKISTSFSDTADNIDFKSNNPFADFDKILKKSVSAIQAIYTEADQE